MEENSIPFSQSSQQGEKKSNFQQADPRKPQTTFYLKKSILTATAFQQDGCHTCFGSGWKMLRVFGSYGDREGRNSRQGSSTLPLILLTATLWWVFWAHKPSPRSCPWGGLSLVWCLWQSNSNNHSAKGSRKSHHASRTLRSQRHSATRGSPQMTPTQAP